MIILQLFIGLCYLNTSIALLVKVLNLSNELIPYKTAWEWQKQLLDWQINAQDHDNTNNNTPVGHLVLLQHSPVYTLGTASEEGSGPFSKITADGSVLEYELFEIERAGQATYHGPGQIVMYPILDLNYFEKDINTYLRGLEEVTVQTLNKYDIKGSRKEGLTGVWVDESKLCAIGIKLRRWVTMHGIALNVNPDMRYFNNIVPCGISDEALSVGMIAQWQPSITVPQVAEKLRDCFQDHYKVEIDEISGQKAIAYLNTVICNKETVR